MTYRPIEDYGVIGDQETAAFVGMDGSIDFMCFPHFDSPSLFAALLDSEKGGRFAISPVRDARNRQMYIPGTNVLLTRFLFPDGVAELSDFMPVEPEHHRHSLVRRVKSVRGDIDFHMECAPRFDYARANHRVEVRGDDEVVFQPDGKGLTAVRLRSSMPFEVQDGNVVSRFTLRSGESAAFVLEKAGPDSDTPSSQPDYVADAFKRTLDYWREWIGRSNYNGRWYDIVHRSALILKLMIYQPTGAIIASPTFGVPEVVGGDRNWDYRFTWIRDAAFTLYALMRLGYTDEAANYMGWIVARCSELRDGETLQPMYSLEGNPHLPEQRLDHLEGYRGSTPVLVGNAAHEQLQLDIYGELMDTVYMYDKFGSPISHDLWTDLSRLVSWVSESWNQPDESIWEERGGRNHCLYSRVLCWVALDRAVKLSAKRSLPGPISAWQEARDAIYRDIYGNFWNTNRKAFVRHKGGDTVDSSALLLPLVRFISPTDPRWLSTLSVIEEDLVYDSLVYRYLDDDDKAGKREGTFNMCSFWYVECLSRAGRLKEARLYFEKMLGYANHLGLFSEELGPQGEHLGNFPQGFTHMALISAAYDLNRRLTEAGEKS